MADKPAVLLLHPPGPRGRRYQLDTYCSQPQKGPFRWHPYELLAFASSLRGQATVQVLDLGLPGRKQMPHTDRFDAVVGLIGAYGWEDHVRFWKKFVARNPVPVWLSGDIARHDPALVFEALPGLAGIIPEFCLPPTVVQLCSPPDHQVHLWRPDRTNYAIPKAAQGWSQGIQDYSLWRGRGYKLPFVDTPLWASTLTQTGCPYTCDYCMVSAYAWAPRDLEEFAREVFTLKEQGVQHLYVRDATFNTKAAHIEQACEILRSSGLTWNTFARIETIDRWVELLADSGCKTLQFGLDAPDRSVLARHSKKVRDTDYQSVLQTVRKAGIESVGHFVLGLDESGPFGIAEFARNTGLDWITITPLMRRPGTALWQKSIDPAQQAHEAPRSLRLRNTVAQAGFYMRSPLFRTLIRRYMG